MAANQPHHDSFAPMLIRLEENLPASIVFNKI